MDDWRESLRKGVKRYHEPTNLLLRGGVDDVWIDKKTDELIVVDYKATSKKGEVNIDADWQDGYKKQIEFYQWLLRGNGFKVSNTGYFVYCNGIKDSKVFDNCLNFEVKILPYKANDSWVTPALKEIKNCLNSDELPEESDRCDYCAYNRKIKLFG